MNHREWGARFRAFMADIESEITTRGCRRFEKILISPDDLERHRMTLRPGIRERVTRMCFYSVEMVADPTIKDGHPVLVARGQPGLP